MSNTKYSSQQIVHSPLKPSYDIVLIGGGIMSATLGVLLHEFAPELRIALFERQSRPAQESSAAWNNAGTGHSAFCELNYTPQNSDGSVDISKAETVAEQFELSKQFWSYLLAQGHLQEPQEFIRHCPHMSLVFGEKDVFFLQQRYAKMRQNPLFADMQFSTDHEQLKDWLPLVMSGRDDSEQLAATAMHWGTDVNYEALTTKLVDYLANHCGVDVFVSHEVTELKQQDDKCWLLAVRNRQTKEKQRVTAGFTFIGAGGYALPLLEHSGIEEGKGYGGFPVSGQWLVSTNPELIKKHRAKVYTQAPVNAPPMSVPHLDLRIIDGEEALLFGPFAGFSTKFLKHGNYLDLPESITVNNLESLLGVWWHNLPLTKYLIEQVMMTKSDRIEHLKLFIKDTNPDDWTLKVAGQRVQIIKKDKAEGGKLEFGTEVIVHNDKSIAALLGASPGASTAVATMMTVLEQCFSTKLQSQQWQDKLAEMLPGYGLKLAENAELLATLRGFSQEQLQLSQHNLQS